MGMFADRAKKKEDELSTALGKKMSYSQPTVPTGAKQISTPNTISKGVSSGTPTFMDRVNLSNEKASRFYAQNAADMQTLPKTNNVLPAVYNKAKSVAGNVTQSDINSFQNISPVNKIGTGRSFVLPKGGAVLPSSNKTDFNMDNITYLPSSNKLPIGVLPKTKAETGLDKANKLATFYDTPQRLSKIEQGNGVLSRVRNVTSSYADSLKGSEESIKATLKQSILNEKEYRKQLSSVDDTINNVIIARNKLNPSSQEYKKLNAALNDIYEYANSFRNRPADNTEANKWFDNTAKLQQKATEGLNSVGRELASAGISVGDNLVTLAMTGFNPAATLTAMGAKAAGSKMNELNNQGVSAADSLGRGVLSGGIEAATEKIGLDNLMDVVATGGKGLARNLLKQSLSEGGEETLSYLGNYAADKMANDPNAKFDVGELGESTLQGGLSGLMFGAGGTAVNSINSKYNNPIMNNSVYKGMGVLPTSYNESTKPYRGVTNGEELLKGYVDSYNGKTFATDNLNNAPLMLTAGADFYSGPFGTYTIDNINNSKQSGTFERRELTGNNAILKDDVLTFDKLKKMSEQKNQNLSDIISKIAVDNYNNPSFEKWSILNSVNRITDNMRRMDVTGIRLNNKGNYEVTYGRIDAPTKINNAKFYQGRLQAEINTNQEVQAQKNNRYLSMPNLYEGNKTPVFEKLPMEKTNDNNTLGIVNKDAEKMFDSAKGIKAKLKTGYQSAVSGWAPFERMSKVDTDTSRNIAARVNKYAQKGGITDTLLTRGLYDNNGNKVSDVSFVSVVSQVPKADFGSFNDYLQNLHNIDRQAQGKPVNSNTAVESQNIVAQYDIQHPEFKQYRQNLTGYWDTFVKTWMVDTGLISQQDYDNLKKMYPNYIPTFRVEDGVFGGSGTVNAGKKIIGGKSIGKAKGGTAPIVSFEESFAKKMQSIVAAASKNDISREIFNFAKDMPNEAAKNGILLQADEANRMMSNADIDDYFDSIDKNIAKEISKDNFEITFYDNGVAKKMRLNRDVYEAFRFLDSKLGDNRAINGFANIGRFFTNKMRALTTTYNPKFFLTNFIRDVQTYAINNTAGNSAMAAKNYAKAIAGMIIKAETYGQYKAMGGSQNGYVGSNMYQKTANRLNPNKSLAQRLASIPRLPMTVLEKMGEATETVPRYAEYLNTIDTMGNTEQGRLQASLNASDVTVNFNRSSTISSFLNAWIPYFNAGLQGMDKTIRQFKSQPGKTAVQVGAKTLVRATAIAFLPKLIEYMINKDNPYWKDLKDGVKDSYILIPNLSGPIDENGYAETFIRIPSSREWGALMGASLTRFVRAIDDESISMKESFDGYGQTVLNSFMPPDLGDWIGGSYSKLKNNRAWHGGKIVPSNLEQVSPEYQQDINTSGIAINLAKGARKLPMPKSFKDTFGSPIKMDYLIDSYGGYAGDVLQGLSSQRNIGKDDMETFKNSMYSGFAQPFVNRLSTDSAYSSYALERMYDAYDKAAVAANDKNFADGVLSDYKTPEESLKSYYLDAVSSVSDLTKQEKAILASPASISEKNRQIRELRKQKNEIARDTLKGADEVFANYKSNYIPEVSALDKDKQENVRGFKAQYNLSDSQINDIVANYRSIKNSDKNDFDKTLALYGYYDKIGYTDGTSQRDSLEDLFQYGSVSPYSIDKYQKINSGSITTDKYVEISEILSDVTYKSGVSGAKSTAYSKAIDKWIRDNGIQISNSDRKQLKIALGVGKTYAGKIYK